MPRAKTVVAGGPELANEASALPKPEPWGKNKARKRRGGRPYRPKFVEEAAAAVEDALSADGRKPLRAEEQQFQPEGDAGLTDIWERRLLNPDGVSSVPIRVKTPGMRLRWINLSNHGRYQRARYEQGWVPVLRTELVDEREIHGVGYTAEGYVCRGERQGEMLMKIPEVIFKRIQKRRADLNKKSYDTLRDNMASAGSQHFTNKYGRTSGDQAAEAVGQFRGSVKFGTERVDSSDLVE